MQISSLPTNYPLQNTLYISIFIEIGNHYQFVDYIGGHFGNGGIVKMTLNAIFITTNQFLTSKYP
jgi:hypothetical protein